ncbi:MAG: aldo/keto reductase [Proteobacteria bacterium]|nr:MAG: aldo/keto reductase [Pseudomonadota bacterium]
MSQALGGVTRRRALRLAGGVLAAACLPSSGVARDTMRTRRVPRTAQAIPVVGMGTWITFNVGRHAALRNDRLKVLRTFFDLGGGMIDSSPMYGSSEEVVGYCLSRLPPQPSLVAATKVWTRTRALGIRQMRDSERKWGIDRFDLMQVHNLVDWRTHLDTLLEWKAAGRVRYIGVTTSHGMRHDELAAIMRAQAIDFVQFTYNVMDREAERRLLPLAADSGIGVIVNRPFQGGRLFDRIAAKGKLPDFAGEIGCDTWASFFLKFVISHPAVTCAIPATSRVDHMRQNMLAGYGELPDAALRDMMAQYAASV